MNLQDRSGSSVRAAGRSDAPFLARMAHEASLPPLGTSFWEMLLTPSGTDVLSFLEAVLGADASRWGVVEDFIVVEVAGRPAATCAVFRPNVASGANDPLDLSKLPAVAGSLSWDQETTEVFRAAYQEMWKGDGDVLKPQADMIVEVVAVAPGFRGQGLGHRLMEAAFAKARDCGACSLGVSVINGNVAAQTLYAKVFEPYVTYHPAYFDHKFPGVTKYRATLN